MQAVVIAAGMDSRAFRLEWPENLVLFEVDRDDVFDHKEAVLGGPVRVRGAIVESYAQTSRATGPRPSCRRDSIRPGPRRS